MLARALSRLLSVAVKQVEAKDSLAYTLGEWYKWSSSPSLVELYGFTVANAWSAPPSTCPTRFPARPERSSGCDPQA